MASTVYDRKSLYMKWKAYRDTVYGCLMVPYNPEALRGYNTKMCMRPKAANSQHALKTAICSSDIVSSQKN